MDKHKYRHKSTAQLFRSGELLKAVSTDKSSRKNINSKYKHKTELNR